MTRSSSSAAGFTLLEMLLTVGTIGLLMVMVSRISTDFIQQRNAQDAAAQIMRMADITEDAILRSSPSISGFAVFTAIGASGQNVGGNINRALRNNGFDIDNTSLRIANARVNVVYALSLSGPGVGSGLFIFRSMIFLNRPFPLPQAIKIARAIGARGGVIRQNNPTTIVSAFGNWSYQMTNDIASQLGAMPMQPGEAYVIAYRALSPSDVIGPYLNKYGDGGANVMHNDLLMNGNSIVRAKDIEVGTLTATKGARFDQLAVNGQANFQGGIDANDAVAIKGKLSVADGDMSVTNGDLKVPGGNVTAKGLRADSLEANDLTTKDLATQKLTVDGGDTLITSKLTVSGGASLDITGALKATVVDADDIKTRTMRTETLNVKDTTSLGGATTINNATAVDQLILNGCMRLEGKTYGTCQ